MLGWLVIAACDAPKRAIVMEDAPPPDVPPYVMPDAAPPPFDAAPLPEMACNAEPDAGPPCELPPSQCLDAWYLIYYTGGDCVDGTCQFETNWLYCYGGCQSFADPSGGAGCGGGFT